MDDDVTRVVSPARASGGRHQRSLSTPVDVVLAAALERELAGDGRGTFRSSSFAPGPLDANGRGVSSAVVADALATRGDDDGDGGAFAGLDLQQATSLALELGTLPVEYPGDAPLETLHDGGLRVMHDALFDEAVPVDVREIALRDPKRARRILANRQSAARSKERKQRYVQSLNERFATLEEEEKALIMEAEALATAVATRRWGRRIARWRCCSRRNRKALGARERA